MREQAPGAHGAARIEQHPLLGPAAATSVVRISFDGRVIPAREGESLIAALLAAGVRAMRTMPRTGEPRGGYCLVGRCADCMVVVDGVANVRACVTTVRAGMRVETQHGLGHWPESSS